MLNSHAPNGATAKGPASSRLELRRRHDNPLQHVPWNILPGEAIYVPSGVNKVEAFIYELLQLSQDEATDMYPQERHPVDLFLEELEHAGYTSTS